MSEVLFKIRVFRDHVNILARKGSRWVRVYRVYRDFDPEVFGKLVGLQGHGVVKRMHAYGSIHATTYREVVVSIDELRALLGNDVVEKILRVM